MSCCRNASSSFGGESPWTHRNGRCGRPHWKPLEILAMVLGFIVFWPIGLAILFAKLWQRHHGDEGDVFTFAREQAARFQQGFSGDGAEKGFGGWRSTGNVAFDEWRDRELARLEEERRKLAEAEQEFARHIEELRRARDREEFESFMRARAGRSS